MPKVTLNNNVQLYYETYGSGEPLVFIHGFAVDHSVFSTMPEHFQNNYRVILLDNRGSGQSDCPDHPYTIDLMADDIIELCRILNLNACHFVGHSMGGMILQRLAYQYPRQVLSATLCNTELKIDIRYALAAKARLVFMEAGCPPRALIESAMGWSFSSSFLEQPDMIEQIIQLRLANPFPISAAGYQNQLSALLAFNSRSWVNQIKAPCLVIGSDQDMIMHELNIRELADLIPNARYECINGAGHASFIEQPATFRRLLQQFLQSQAHGMGQVG